MPIYDQPVRVLLADMIEEFKSSGQFQFGTSDAIAWFNERYPKIKEGTIRAHLRRFSANDPIRLHYTPKPGEGLLFKLGVSEYRMYDPQKDPPEILPGDSTRANDADESDTPVEQVSSEFAYERDLQSYLAKNLDLIEPGLKLWVDEDSSINGIEFDAGGRRIDILAIDAKGGLVVIELKVSKGYDRVIGQLLRYMAWIKKHHADDGQSVRGVIVSRLISDDLRLATGPIQGVSLFEYSLSIALTPVSTL